MMLRIWNLGVDVKWAKSGEWTVTKRLRNIDIQYGLWLWIGPIRQDGIVAFGFTVGPLKIFFGMLNQ